MSKLKYKPGDRIVYTGWGGGAGVVVKCSPKTAQIRLDKRDRDERYDLSLLRPETAEDVAKRERKARIDEWHAAMPKTTHLRATSGSVTYSAAHDRVQMFRSLETPEEMREAASELQALACWFATKPKD